MTKPPVVDATLECTEEPRHREYGFGHGGQSVWRQRSDRHVAREGLRDELVCEGCPAHGNIRSGNRKKKSRAATYIADGFSL